MDLYTPINANGFVVMTCNLHFERVAVVVAHPDDETLWAGGTILLHARWHWEVFTLCRATDPDRAPRFAQALRELGATGRMADLDDGPDQHPLPEQEVQDAVYAFLGDTAYDLVITHGPAGEYTRHLRHEEACRAVTALWEQDRLRAQALWLFAYNDDGGRRLPKPADDADFRLPLPPPIWEAKRRIVTEVYGFAADSWETRTTPCVEAFRCFDNPVEYRQWLKRGYIDESAHSL